MLDVPVRLEEFIYTGVMWRFPRLRVAFVEVDAGLGALLEGTGLQPLAPPGPRPARRTGDGRITPLVHGPDRFHLHHGSSCRPQPPSRRPRPTDVVERLPAQHERPPLLVAHDRIGILRGARWERRAILADNAVRFFKLRLTGAACDPGRRVGTGWSRADLRGLAGRADRPLPVVLVVSDIWGDGDHLPRRGGSGGTPRGTSPSPPTSTADFRPLTR